jgi:hypothetical protein
MSSNLQFYVCRKLSMILYKYTQYYMRVSEVVDCGILTWEE